MKKVLKIQLIVCAILLLCTNNVKAATVYTDGPLQYTIMSDGNIEIVEYFGEDSDVKIPMAIGYHIVTSIKAGAFEESNVTSISIPESVVYYDGAFPKTANVDIYDAKGEIISRLQEAAKEDDNPVTPGPSDPSDDEPDNPNPQEPTNPGDDEPVNPNPHNPTNPGDNPTNPNQPGKKDDDNGNVINNNTGNKNNENNTIILNNDIENSEDESNDVVDVFDENESNNVINNDINSSSGSNSPIKPTQTSTTLTGIKPIGYVFIGGFIVGILVFMFIKKKKHKK